MSRYWPFVARALFQMVTAVTPAAVIARKRSLEGSVRAKVIGFSLVEFGRSQSPRAFDCIERTGQLIE